MKIIKTTASEKETIALAKTIAEKLQAGDVVTLNGRLGAGKTTFTKGIAEGLGIKEVISSPTFTIIKEYDNSIPLYHIDAYRLEFSEEDLGFEDYFYNNGITIIEWAEFIEEYLPETRLEITIIDLNHNKREFILTSIGNSFKTRFKNF